MQEMSQKFSAICRIRNTDALCGDTMAAQAALQPILKENKTLNIKTERIMYNGTTIFLCCCKLQRYFLAADYGALPLWQMIWDPWDTWTKIGSSTSTDHLRWHHLCEKVCNSELRLSLRQFFMKGHLVVWSLVRPVATKLGRVYHILRGTIYRRRISYDGQWRGKWVGQPKDYFSLHRGRRRRNW